MVALRHPRRFGFVAFNLLMLAGMGGLLALYATSVSEGELGAVPNAVLALGGLVVLGIVWLGSWVAWVVMNILRRHRPLR